MNGMIMKQLVEVTAGDIECGVRGSARECPVALAVSRALDTGVRVGVHRVYRENRLASLPLPSAVAEFIINFDTRPEDTHFEPFSFEIELPEPDKPSRDSHDVVVPGVTTDGDMLDSDGAE
jgi:hypothetical protein